MKNKSIHSKFPLIKIKKIVQENEEVGKLKNSTPLVISLALEDFLEKVMNQMKQKYGDKEKWTESHLKEFFEETD